jgi:hypothetical protein
MMTSVTSPTPVEPICPVRDRALRERAARASFAQRSLPASAGGKVEMTDFQAERLHRDIGDRAAAPPSSVLLLAANAR